MAASPFPADCRRVFGIRGNEQPPDRAAYLVREYNEEYLALMDSIRLGHKLGMRSGHGMALRDAVVASNRR